MNSTVVAILVLLLGIFNIIVSILALQTRGLVLQLLTHEIVQFLGFSQLVVGWIMTVISYGLHRKDRFAWQAALILLLVSVVLNGLQVNIFGIVFSIIIFVLVYASGQKYRLHLPFFLDIKYIALAWAIVFVILYGTVGSFFYGSEFTPPIDNYIKAFYYTVTIITTVGFGDILPASDVARLFTASLVIVGVSIFLVFTVILAQSLVSRLEYLSEKTKKKKSRTKVLSDEMKKV
ncbi:MAG: ion channel [Nitrososphaerales archaeon]|jgi:voltage-gated potassium channel|nr:ion channel [Nitrososphaerales archaeon]|tara:strand:- start:529 stop:1230 length:702 start_codon:yes stop_codon:yes gene_type:complete